MLRRAIRAHSGLSLVAVVGVCAIGPPPAGADERQLSAPSVLGTSKNFNLVGHDPLLARGWNGALAMCEHFAYAGFRGISAEKPGIVTVDVEDPSRPRVVGRIPPILPGESARELRVWPQNKLLISQQMNGDFSIRFFDLTGKNAARPRLLSTYHPRWMVHEFYLWVDPARPGRALMYLTRHRLPQVEPYGGPTICVVDISRAREGIVEELATFDSWNVYSGGSTPPVTTSRIRWRSLQMAIASTSRTGRAG
jgi:hypothetical protein